MNNKGLQEDVYKMLKQQQQHWDLAEKNYRGLQKVKKRFVSLGEGVEVGVQFNPERIYSSAAKVDDKSISRRKCFLCRAHLPEQQTWVEFEQNYLILVNPFPIFPLHLTIPIVEHSAQRIEGRMSDMLKLARMLNDFVVFYNGPRCGASAPDHFHFQAGNKGFMPIEDDAERLTKMPLGNKNNVSVWMLNKYKRSCVVLEGADPEALCALFDQLLDLMQAGAKEREEPMMNVLASYREDKYVVYVFPRKLHRPWQYFAEGDRQILLSPASVDLGGVMITPREIDYHKMNQTIIEDIFEQVCVDNTEVMKLVNALFV